MSTSSSAASSSAIFNGTSRFSSDFQAVITRAVSIATLPITQLNTSVTALQGQASAVTSLGTQFKALKAAIQGLQSATGLGSLSSSVSDSSAQVNLSAGAVPATYTLQVNSLGTYSNTLSNDGLTTVSDPASQNITAGTSFTLAIDGATTTITPAAQNLESLVSAINEQPGLNVQASVVNVGSGSAPDYRLSLQSSKLGAVSIQLSGNSGNLLNTLSTGTLASYNVDGLQTAITSDSRTVTLAPGVSVNLLAESPSAGAATITVSQQTGAIGNALSTLVSAYNSTVDALNTNHGSANGALEGQSLIQTLSSTLEQLGSYSSGSSGIGSLASLGVTYDTAGHLSFDQGVFSSATSGQLAALTNFLGGATTGGFLQSATNLLTSVEDPTSGLLAAASVSIQTEINTDTDLIATDQTRVTQLQNSLQQQLAKSDALVASLEQSYSVLSGTLQAESYDKQQTSNGY